MFLLLGIMKPIFHDRFSCLMTTIEWQNKFAGSKYIHLLLGHAWDVNISKSIRHPFLKNTGVQVNS